MLYSRFFWPCLPQALCGLLPVQFSEWHRDDPRAAASLGGQGRWTESWVRGLQPMSGRQEQGMCILISTEPCRRGCRDGSPLTELGNSLCTCSRHPLLASTQKPAVQLSSKSTPPSFPRHYEHSLLSGGLSSSLKVPLGSDREQKNIAWTWEGLAKFGSALQINRERARKIKNDDGDSII